MGFSGLEDHAGTAKGFAGFTGVERTGRNVPGRVQGLKSETGEESGDDGVEVDGFADVLLNGPDQAGGQALPLEGRVCTQ